MRGVVIAARVYGLTAGRIALNVILGIWARRRPGVTYRAEPWRHEQSAELQREFAAIFRRYDECQRCVEHCCHSQVNRFDIVDVYIAGRPVEQGFSPWHRPGHLKDVVADLMRDRLKEPGERTPPNENCEHFEPSIGCRLAIGDRPAMCISGVCMKFLSAMSEEDARAYGRLLRRFSVFRRRCSINLFRDMTRSGRGTPTTGQKPG